jgi:aspartyl-tRNA synthetase
MPSEIYSIPIQMLYPLLDEGEYYVFAKTTPDYPLSSQNEELTRQAANHGGNLYAVTTDGHEWQGPFANVLSNEVKKRLIQRFSIKSGYTELFFSKSRKALESVIGSLSN